jgi:hypothetical protein
MKGHLIMKRLVYLAVSLLLTVPTPLLKAQMPGAPNAGVNSALLKLFGKNNNFTLNADMKILDADDKETMSMTCKMAVLDGKLRTEVDMAGMKSAMLPPQAAAQLKAMGMDKVVSIAIPAKDQIFLIYPGLKSYVDMPTPKAVADAAKKEPKIEKTAVGKETIDGHACVKNKVVMTDDKGKKQEITVWEATDLKDFPIKVQMTEQGQNIVMQYKDIQFTKPEAKQFDIPDGFAKYDSMQTLMMEKMSAGFGK